MKQHLEANDLVEVKMNLCRKKNENGLPTYPIFFFKECNFTQTYFYYIGLI